MKRTLTGLAQRMATWEEVDLLGGDLGARCALIEGRASSLESADIGLDGRLDTLEGQTLDARIDTIEGQTLDARLDTIEALDISSRLANAEWVNWLPYSEYTITDAPAFEITSNYGLQFVTIGANRTPKAAASFDWGRVRLLANASGAYTITWTDATFGSGGVKWIGGVAPTIPQSPGWAVIDLWRMASQIYGRYIGGVT